MIEIKKIIKNKIFITIIGLFFVLIFLGLWNIVSGGYDKQNSIVIFLKKIIPTSIAKKVRDTVFIIPDLKEQNRILSLQVEKFEQGLNGNIFNDEIILSNKKKEFIFKEFFLPFPRLDLRLGWAATENSRRAHYLEIIEDKIIVISGFGQTIYFDKKNIFENKLKQKKIPNNITNILSEKNMELIGIRDLYFDDGNIYISLQSKSSKGFGIDIYKAKFDLKKLDFELFFKSNEYWDEYNVFSGGRIENYKDNKIIFSIGYNNVRGAAQSMDSLFGKIVSVDKTTGEHDIISMGHRNPQGLHYVENLNLIINTEHGPKGGDEINFNYQDNNKIPNYGWDIASYGVDYPTTAEHLKIDYKKSHNKHGFVEPFKYFTPSVGISEIIYISNEQSLDKQNYLYVASLRGSSIYLLKLKDDLSKIIQEDRIYFSQQRIRDLKYDSKNQIFFIIFENTPSIGILKPKT